MSSEREASDFPEAIPSRWRAQLRNIVSALSHGDYVLAAIPGVEPLRPKVVAHLRANIADFGETLVELPEDSWSTSVVAPAGSRLWDVLVDLWTAESGSSDLVLAARVTEVDGEIRIRVDGVYVP